MPCPPKLTELLHLCFDSMSLSSVSLQNTQRYEHGQITSLNAEDRKEKRPFT